MFPLWACFWDQYKKIVSYLLSGGNRLLLERWGRTDQKSPCLKTGNYNKLLVMVKKWDSVYLFIYLDDGNFYVPVASKEQINWRWQHDPIGHQTSQKIKKIGTMTYFSLFIGPLKNNLIRAKTYFWEKFREWWIWLKFYKMAFFGGGLRPLKPHPKNVPKNVYLGAFFEKCS